MTAENFILKYRKPLLSGLSVSSALLLLIALFSQLTFSEELMNSFFSSDTLYLPSLYKDLVQDANKFGGWHLNPAPNYFPDMLFYFFLMYISGSLLISSFVFSIVQYLFIGFLFVKLFRKVFPGRSLVYTALIYGLLSVILLEAFFFTQDFYYLFNLLYNAYHAGAFVLSLLCLLLTLNYISGSKWTGLFLIFLIGFLAIISDRLFIVLYVIPVCICSVILCRKIGIRQSLYLILTVFVMAVTGMYTHKHMDTDLYNFLGESKPADWTIISSQLWLFFNQMLDYMTSFGFRAFSLYLFIVSFGLMSYVFINSLKEKSQLISFYSLFSLVFSIFVLFVPMLSGKYIGGDCLRYNVYPFYLAVLNFAVFVAYSIKNETVLKRGRRAIIYLNLILLITGFMELRLKGLKDYFNYYPEIVREIDALAERKNLKVGVGNFWEAKKITVFSKKNVKVYAVFDDISFYQHAANDDWYYNNVFNFVVISGIADTTQYKQKLKEIKWISNTPNLKLVKVHPFIYARHLGSISVNTE